MADQETIPRTLLFDPERRQQLIELGWWVSIPLNVVSAHWFYQGENRLNANYYSNETFAALRILSDGGFETKELNELGVTAYHPTQSQPRSNFKRIYAAPDQGTPFLTTTEMYAFRPTTDKYLSSTMEKLGELLVKPGDLLMSRSGTVARPIYVNKYLSQFAATDDAIRIFPGQLPVGFLYAFLSSWVGRALVSKNEYGVTVKHLEAPHLVSIPCPILPQEEVFNIHNEIMKAYELRDRGNEYLDLADETIHEELGLPRFNEDLVPYLPLPKKPETEVNHLEIPHPKAFSVNNTELSERLDASYHIPIANTVLELLGKCGYPLKQLSEGVNRIYIPNRFKRVYVEQLHGLHFATI